MPFKSVAERERLRRLVDAGQFSRAAFDALVTETGDRALPERLTPPSAPRLSAGGSTQYHRAARQRGLAR